MIVLAEFQDRPCSTVLQGRELPAAFIQKAMACSKIWARIRGCRVSASVISTKTAQQILQVLTQADQPEQRLVIGEVDQSIEITGGRFMAGRDRSIEPQVGGTMARGHGQQLRPEGVQPLAGPCTASSWGWGTG